MGGHWGSSRTSWALSLPAALTRVLEGKVGSVREEPCDLTLAQPGVTEPAGGVLQMLNRSRCQTGEWGALKEGLLWPGLPAQRDTRLQPPPCEHPAGNPGSPATSGRRPPTAPQPCPHTANSLPPQGAEAPDHSGTRRLPLPYASEMLSRPWRAG